MIGAAGAEVERENAPTSSMPSRLLPQRTKPAHLPGRRALLEGQLCAHSLPRFGRTAGCGATLTALRRTASARAGRFADCVNPAAA